MDITITQLDNHIDAMKAKIEFADKLKSLMNNKDFKAVFIDRYCGEFAADLVKAKASPHMQNAVDQKYVDDQITAIGHFQQFISVTAAEAEAAYESIKSTERERENMLEEGIE